MHLNNFRKIYRELHFKTPRAFCLVDWIYELCRLPAQAKKLRALASSKSFLDVFRVVESFEIFAPAQKRTEILRLMDLLNARRPHYICEIGSANGGTTFLFAQCAAGDAKIATLDIKCSLPQRIAFSNFAGDDQVITCIRADSHDKRSVFLVKRLFSNQAIDFLFIDGDHSYDGVARDFQLYSPLVKERGIIAFHDIVPDSTTRFGKYSCSNVGQVPKFWSEIKREYGKLCQEIIEDFNQDGYGIGVLQWPGGQTSI